MKYIIYCYIILMIFTCIKSLIRLNKSNNFLTHKHDLKLNKKEKIKVIIPAMNELKNVKKSVNYFKKLNNYCDVIYVTTSKEKTKSTYNEIEKEIKEQKTKNIKVINCPNVSGTMANQLNYATKELSGEEVIAIYNIDSKPEEKTFKYVLKNINDRSVYQQVSYFDNNHKGIMKSAENWQNRWSIIYELGKYLSNRKIEFKYCIGHGLFMKKKILEKYGFFSEKDINEDNEFGYRLMINKIDIKPIPYLEQADFANNKMIYIKQQSTWVNGPLYAFKYFFNNEKSVKNFIITILNFKAFLSWWLLPLVSYVCIIIALFYSIKLFLILVMLVIFYVTGINYLSNKTLIKNGYLRTKYKINILSDLLFFMIHSFGSYITLYKLITGKNNIKNKYNTEK